MYSLYPLRGRRLKYVGFDLSYAVIWSQIQQFSGQLAITVYRTYGLVQPNFQQMEVFSRYAGQLRMCPVLVHQLVCWTKIKRPIAVNCVNVIFIQALELYEYFIYASDDV